MVSAKILIIVIQHQTALEGEISTRAVVHVGSNMTESESSHKPDVAFIQKVLREYEDDLSLEIQSVDVSPGCDKGDNYMSVVNRLAVTGNTRNGLPYCKSFISKSLPRSEYHKEVFQTRELFANEATMYRLLPILLGKKQKIVANCLFADTEQIILEDLKPQGFLLADRIEGLDFDHTKIVLEKLAELHAASLILEHNDRERFFELRKNVVEILFTDTEPPGVGKFVNDLPNFITLCLKTAATPEDDNLKEISFMNEHRGKIYNVLKEIVKPTKFSVLCAGDLWINNLLFKYAERNGEKVVNDVRFLDFQISRFAPLVIDILYFLHTSVPHELLLEKVDTFLEIYHTRLRSKLSVITGNAFDEITFEWLQSEIEKYRLYGLFMSLWLAPAAMMDAKDAPDELALAAQTAENEVAVDYWKDKLSPRLLQRIVHKCKYFIK